MPEQPLCSIVAPMLAVVEKAKESFALRLRHIDSTGGLTREMYIRYLSFQFHLTKGVQRHFLKVTAHPELSGNRKLREFLFKFALEEESHYKVAEVDLERMGEQPLPCPLDVSLWWAYLDQIVEVRPFVRLGVAAVLENLGAGAGVLGHRLLDEAGFLTKANTRFLAIHFHEVLPHGVQIVEAIKQSKLNADNICDLEEGANIGAILYLRLVDWALLLDQLTTKHFSPFSSIARSETGEYSELDELTAY